MSYSYKNLPQLIELLDQHFKQTDNHQFRYELINPDVMQYSFIENGKTVHQTECSIYDPNPYPKNTSLEYNNWFFNQWFEFNRTDIPLPNTTGPDIILGENVIVTDPCYDEDTWCNGTLTNILPGTWRTKTTHTNIASWGDRTSALIIWHEAYSEPTKSSWKKTDITVGVDSGQAGIIDLAHFRQMNVSRETADNWYSNIKTYEYGRGPVAPNLKPRLEAAKAIEKRLNTEFANTHKNFKPESLEQYTKYLELYRKRETLLQNTPLDQQSLTDDMQQTCMDKLWTDKHSVITSSGLGDGSYTCLIAKDKESDQIIGIKIDYFYNSEDE